MVRGNQTEIQAEHYPQPWHGGRGERAGGTPGGNLRCALIVEVGQPSPEALAITGPPGQAARDEFRPAAREDELPTVGGLRKGETKAGHAGNLAESLFEQRQEVAGADGMNPVHFMLGNVAGIQGDVMESWRCWRMRGQRMYDRVLHGWCCESVDFKGWGLTAVH